MGNTSSSPPPPPPVATITSGANTSTPTIVLNSVGTFNIVATASSSINFTQDTIPSLPIQVYGDKPDIKFSPIVTEQSPYTYIYEKNSYKYIEPAASITNNTGQILIYSIVTADSTTSSLTHSTLATIDPTGYFLTTVSCGTFRICATADVTSNGDFDSNVVLSDILTIVKATPTILLPYPQINLNITPLVTASTLVYGQSYTIIPDPSQISIITSNTDTNPYPNINYTSSDATIATISGSTVTIVGIGNFQIMTTVSQTTNYKQILRSPSPQIYETIQAVPTINTFPTTALSAQNWVYNQSYSEIIPIANKIPTTNTDGPLITYESSDKTIATISGNTITITGVGNFQILVKIHSTTNFYAVTYTYPSPTTYYTTEWATPIITFPKTFVTSSMYGSTYKFVTAIISNNDPSQMIQYSIINSIPVVPSSTSVATLVYKSGVPNPSVIINSVGTFQIQASCLASANGYYSSQVTQPIAITISKEKPKIVFTTSNFNSIYICKPSSPYSFSGPIASITNNKVQSLTYSIVDTDGETPSTVATISSDGTSLTTNNVGSFQILATATATSNGDYGGDSLPSETITIRSGTPTIITFPILPLNFTYGNTYTIPYTTTPPYTITTTNIDIPGPIITYSSSNTAVATISGSVNYSSISNSAISSINGTSITIVGVGSFQINVTIVSTTNYNQATYVYPSPTTYYTSVQATPTITFPSNFGSGWVIGGTYNLTSTVTTNAGPGYPIPNPVIYSIINPSVSNIATITTSGSGSGSGSQITINDAGTFQIQAGLAATPNFTSATSVQSNTITIVTSNVSLLSNNFSNFVYGGGPYTLSVTTNNTDTNPAPTITYQIFPQSGSTGNGTINGNVLTITAAGGAYIYVNITATQNFNSLNTCVYVYIAQATPVVVMNSTWINSQIYAFTIGTVFGAYSLFSSNSNTDPGVTYSLSASISNGIGTVSIQNNTVFCNAPGIFSLQVTSNATANFQAYSFQTPSFYVSVVPEVIIFNNPQTFPPSASQSGEVGMAICITNDSYPFGFNNYSALTIENYGNSATFTLNANTTPTYSSVIYKYMVFFEPDTAGSFSGALPTDTPSNIAYVGINSIATGMSSGQYLTFTFSGNTVGQGFPDPLTIGWNPGSLDLSQGLVYGAFYSYANNITPPQNLPNGNGVTISTLNSAGITGYYIAPWAGYDTFSVTGGVPALNGYSAIVQAWGLWVNINYGNQFGSTSDQNGVNYYYVGIPQITNPVTYYP
jgi:hypothetical protein